MKAPICQSLDPALLAKLRKLRDTKQMLRQHQEKIASYRDKQIAKLMKQAS